MKILVGGCEVFSTVRGSNEETEAGLQNGLKNGQCFEISSSVTLSPMIVIEVTAG